MNNKSVGAVFVYSALATSLALHSVSTAPGPWHFILVTASAVFVGLSAIVIVDEICKAIRGKK